MRDAVIILEYDTELSRLIARTLRSQQVYCELVSPHTQASELLRRAPRGLILAAGHEEPIGMSGIDPALTDTGVPVLALGNMAPALCVYFGGEVLEVLPGNASVTLGLYDEALFADIEGGENVMHDLRCLTLPECLASIATATERCIGFRHAEKPLYAMQYPIEHNDPEAVMLLKNFAVNICGAKADWDEGVIIDSAVSALKSATSGERAICAVSGGVDSAVAAKLCRMAIGDDLVCVFIDTGLLRKDEPESVLRIYMETMGLNVKYVDARDTFLAALSGVTGDAEKYAITSSLLGKALVKQLSLEPDIHTIVLGDNLNDSLYNRNSAKDLPGELGSVPLRTLAPLCGLFKEEVRRIASTLSLPDCVVKRQPFPASGLATRVSGEVTGEKLETLRSADHIFDEEICQGGHERKLWQYYAVLTMDPSPPHGYAVALRAAQAAQGGAYAARLPYDLLERAAKRILKDIPGVTRVVYDLTPSKHYKELE